ncbi:NAD(P)H-dependent glycerol-3-phosphate dehydrogenase [Oceanomicrobium pacificus]|uniref:Glycerol-3-phosphate dehydrogenase [NAD(P)+] n=1 Tax=Oceanomicrobium pacificus TaxID=2692916 RepID=A0A6B0TJY6_9RHOB|nr:NAD(P)H-dependent glycerol-3-phosphate dehydrogenase [Oceanomicrobium pacificus]MXU64810.1 NAD(P)H-dependent glycerol-3-phosphate dehydrogenase [Oceanomicrobium pacificus]
MNRIGVIGAGAFGSALAIALARGGATVTLWGRDADQVAAMDRTRENARYLPGLPLPEGLAVTGALDALSGADLLLCVVPAQATRRFLEAHAAALPKVPLVLCAKGIERDTGALMSDIAADHWPKDGIAVLSGPGFASELARGLPTALSLAGHDAACASMLQQALSTDRLRLYLSDDPTGVQLGGALKNVIAIACGLAVGAGLGESARAALMTRGFAEMTRLAAAMGARAETLTGLSGLGDLALTCTSRQSRNFAAGMDRASGAVPAEGQTVEGAATAAAAVALAQAHGQEAPIAAAVADVLAGHLSIHEAMDRLLSRPLRQET